MRYFFEDYALDTDRRELRRGARLVPVEPQVFDLLIYLIRNRERVVSKDDLLAAIWKGRVVSETALTSRINSARSAIGDNGQQQRLIKTLLRKGVRFVGAVKEEHAPEAAAQAPFALDRLLDRPSIAVLPFTSMSGDPEQEYFADGIVEEIITALSHLRWLSVIARNSSFIYKGRSVDVKHVGRELGVRYVLEGSVRQSASRVRIAAQLIDAATGIHLWANRFDGSPEDIFALQDQITGNVVGAIGPKLEQTEIERAHRKPTESLDAYDLYLRSMESVYRWTEHSMGDALRLLHRAIEIDPQFAAAYGLAAYCYVQRKSYGWFTDRSEEIVECARLARRAADLGKEDAIALARAGHGLAYVVGDVDSGAALIDRALLLNPNLSSAWWVSGWVRVFLGQPEEAIKHVARARSLSSPFDPLAFKMDTVIAYAHFFAARYDEASTWAEDALRARPDYLTAIRGAAASHALAGRIDQAEKLMAQMRNLDPALRLSNLKDLIPFRRPDDFERWAEGLQKAGLPV